MLSGCSFGDGNIWIIPKDFKGYIVIIFNQKSGVLPKQEGRKIMYEIHAKSILEHNLK
ncbi:DUF6843 domain-containing protein [Dyadobacter chenwenxiniae]|uniref:DUF6843 domain-containing protein n=1 Tax=Dyadobacter chenwenxiniae TaxID=2906456 RepID=UPI0035B5EC73